MRKHILTISSEYDGLQTYVGGVGGERFSTVEVAQYSGGYNSTVEGIQYCGRIASLLWEITAVHVGDTFSTVKVVQYSGG